MPDDHQAVNAMTIIPSQIPYALTRVAKSHVRHVAQTVTSPEERLRAHPKGAAWIHDTFATAYGKDTFKWEDPLGYVSWRNVPAPILLEIFTFEECARFWHDSVVESKLSRHIEKHEPLLWKIRNTQWRYGCTTDWNAMVDHIDGLKRLSTSLPDFELRLTHTHSFNPVGWSEHEVDGKLIYLDAAFAALLYYKGKHVLTIGFSLSAEHVLIAQVQLREKKGNRFLYHLPGHYFDIAINMLGEAFGRDKLALVTGDSAVSAIEQAYRNDPTKFAADARTRVKALYDRPLAGYRRGKEVGQWHGRRFVSLHQVRTRKAA